jgi:electron transfer flavoprotein alpha subunit
MVLVVLDHDGNKLRKGTLEAPDPGPEAGRGPRGEGGRGAPGRGRTPLEEARKYVDILYTATLGPYTAERWAAGVLAAAKEGPRRWWPPPVGRAAPTWAGWPTP